MSETDDDEYAGVPQNKPEGMRLGGDDAERVRVPCPACKGERWYPVEVFEKDPRTGGLFPRTIKQVCATCEATGMITELKE